jgi:hypothetical protein
MQIRTSTMFGAKHGLRGIAGYDAAETKDEDPTVWLQ